MKTFSKIIAVIAILWAVLIPFALFVTEVATHGGTHGEPRIFHRMAQDLRTELPNEPANDTALVSLPAKRVSQLAEMLDNIAEARRADSTGDVRFASIESSIIIILSVCILSTRKKDANIAV
jgi:hypothetical protein